MRWPKYQSFSFSIMPSKKHPGLIPFRMDWLDLLAVQGTLKTLLQYHSSKASILQHSAFFTIQLSHPYMTTGKTIALTRWTFVGKVMSLFLNMLSRLVITFLPRNKHLLISSISLCKGFPGGKMVKSLPSLWGTWVQSWAGKVSWRRKWQPTSVFLPGKSHGQRSLSGYSPWGRRESNVTE